MRTTFYLFGMTALLAMLSCGQSGQKFDVNDINQNPSTLENPDADTKTPKGTPTFETTLHDFGNIKETEGSVRFKYKFKNTGKGTLSIQNVQPACGCTKEEYSTDNIKPGAEGFVTLSFDPTGRGDKEGTPNTKTAVVTFANSTLKTVELKFVAKIFSSEEKNKKQ